VVYLDTSVLGSYYCPESLSSAVDRVLTSLPEAFISPLVEVEFCSLLALKVRTKALDRAAAGAALSQFKVHRADGLYQIVEIGAREYELAGDWLSGFTTNLRTLDALHLAAAFANSQTLLTTDKTLSDAAKRLRVPYHLIHL